VPGDSGLLEHLEFHSLTVVDYLGRQLAMDACQDIPPVFNQVYLVVLCYQQGG
jgi:hypothetical protein